MKGNRVFDGFLSNENTTILSKENLVTKPYTKSGFTFETLISHSVTLFLSYFTLFLGGGWRG